MRILRLDLDQGQTGVDLHPFLTVVNDVDAEQRRELLSSIRSLARGSAAGIRGMLQHQGLLVELDGTGNDRLNTLTGANVVIDADVSLLEDLPRLQAQIDQQRRRAEIDAVLMEEVRADLDPSARSRVAALAARLDPQDEAATTRRRDGSRRLTEAVAALSQQPPTLREAPEGLGTLRHRWDRYTAQLEAAGDHFRHLEAAVAQSVARLEAARVAKSAAEAAAVAVLLTRDEEARLELLSFPGMDETRRGRWRKMLRPEEQAEMDALLTKVGIESWTAYTVYRVGPVASPARIQAADAARKAFEEASTHLAQTRAELAGDERAIQLNQELATIRDAARRYLGLMLPPDLGRALRELVVEGPNPAWVAAAEQLRQLLVEVGADPDLDGRYELALGAGPELADQLAASANRWLAVQEAADRDRHDESLRADLAQARHRLDRHRRALARIARIESAAQASASELAQLSQEASRRAAGGPLTVDAILTRVSTIATQVAVDACGSIAMAVVGTFDGLSDPDLVRLLERCSQLAGGLQVVVVTDRPAAGAWAADAGLGRALVTRPKSLDAGASVANPSPPPA